MANGNSQHFALVARTGEGCLGILHTNLNRLADVLESDIAQQGTRKQASLAKYLKTIADAEYQSITFRKFLHRFHHRRKFSNRTSAQIVSVSEASRYDDGITVLKFM